MISEQQICRFIRAALEKEVASGYARLRRVPSTYTWKTIDYVSALEPARRDSLFEAFACNALYFFWPDRDPNLLAYKTGHEEFRRFVKAMPLIWGWQYYGVRLLRSILADIRSSQPSGAWAQTPESVIQKAEAIRPTSAPEIRKEVKRAFSERFGAGPAKLGGGDWLYNGAYNGRSLTVSIDYGGREDQLRYGVNYEDQSTGLRASRLSYEWMLGMGFGHWDFVTADNLQECIGLLCDLVQELASIPERLESGFAAQGAV